MGGWQITDCLSSAAPAGSALVRGGAGVIGAATVAVVSYNVGVFIGGIGAAAGWY